MNGTEPVYATFPYIDYIFLLSRINSFALHLFVGPAVVLCFITPLVFVLPPGSQEKIIFGTGVIISDLLLLGELIRYVPGSYPTTPLIGKYFLANIVIAALSLAISALIVNVWGRSNTRTSGPPAFVKMIILGPVARWLYASEEHFCDSLEDHGVERGGDSDDIALVGGTSAGSSVEYVVQQGVHSFDTGSQTTQASKARIHQAQTYVRRIIRAQWRQLAVIIDRIFLILYVIVVVCLTLMFAKYM